MAYKNLLVTGGAGFIGSNFIRHLFEKSDFIGRVVNLDSLSYAGNPTNLEDVAAAHGAHGGRYAFVKADIRDFAALDNVFAQYEIDAVCHFAAESHVDRSICGPKDFIETNIVGTFALLEAARKAWKGRHDCRFHHVSTDEVYGSLGAEGVFYETTPYDPRSPYSASKASSDHIVRAYHHTYHLPISISNCSNNYGPYQFPEKMIPVMILNALEKKPLPVYGKGENVRDWLYVEDHCSAVWAIMRYGRVGETYNIGGECERQNLQVVHCICDLMDELAPTPPSGMVKSHRDLISFVTDRPGHDLRYAINCDKIKQELGWRQSVDFEAGLRSTVQWYLHNMPWVDKIRTGEYKNWMDKNYSRR